MSEPRAFTVEEIREQFIDQLRNESKYWSGLPGKTPRERCDGMVFSFLSMLDGAFALPAFDVVTSPHPDDEQYLKCDGENWYPTGVIINDCQLHEIFCSHATPTAQPEKPHAND